MTLLLPPQTEHPYKSKKAVWHKLLSKQRRRAVVACFRMTPLYNLPRSGLGGTGICWEGRSETPGGDQEH